MREIFTLVGRVRTEGLSTLRAGLKSLDKDILKTANKINLLGKNITKIGIGLTKLTAPITAFGIAAVKFGGDFDNAMTESLAIMGNVSDSMKNDMAEAAKGVAKVTTFSAKQAAEAYYFLASAGFSAAASIKALPKVAKFAQAGNFDLALATSLLADAQAALGLASKDVEQNEKSLVRVSDVLVKANTLANASVQQFSEALTNNAGNALSLVNKSVEEGVAVLAAFANKGIKGTEAGVALAIVLRDLQRAAIQHGDAFADAGAHVYDTSGKMRKMCDIIGDLENFLAGASDEQKKMSLMTLGFQEKSIAATMALIGTSDSIREFDSLLIKAGGTTNKVSEKQLKTLWKQLLLLKNRLEDICLTLWETLGPTIMDVVVPKIKELAEKVESLAKQFNKLSPEARKAEVKFFAIIAISGPLLIVLGKTISSIKILCNSFHALTLIMKSNPYVVAIAGLALLTIAIVNTTKGYKDLNKKIKENHELTRKNFEDENNKKIIGSLEEIIYFYDKLSGIDKNPMPEKEYREARRNVEELRRRLGEFGIDLADNYTAGLEKATEKLIEFKLRTVDTTDVIDDETSAIDKNNEAKKDSLELQRQLNEEEAEYKAKQDEDLYGLVKQRMEEVAKIRQKNTDEVYKYERDAKEAQNEFELEKDQENADRMLELRDEYNKKIAEGHKEVFDSSTGLINTFFSAFQSGIDNRNQSLDESYEAERDAIEKSVLSQEDKQVKLDELDEQTDKKKKALRRKQAVLDKLSGLFNIGINTAVGITKAMALLPPLNWIQAALVAATGIAQTAIVMSKPIPAAKGAYVKGNNGGNIFEVGEEKKDEMILPVDFGIKRIVSGVIDGIAGSVSRPVLQALAMAGGFPSSTPATNATSFGGNFSLHIGTLIADERGIKELERRMSKYRFLEADRMGAR